MGELPFPVDQLAPEFLFKLLHASRQCGLRDIALLGRAGEVQCTGDSHKITDLMELHGVFTVSSIALFTRSAFFFNHRCEIAEF